MGKQYYVYMLTNKWNHVLYVGVTNNLERRLWEHRTKVVDGFSKKYNLGRLVYYEEYDDVLAAIEREKQIKSWSRRKKNLLIDSLNPTWEDLCFTSEIATPADLPRARNDKAVKKESVDSARGIDYE